MNRSKPPLVAVLLASLAATAQAEDANLKRARAEEKRLVDLVAKVSEAFVAIGGGSGIIISPEGEVLTNHHVAGSRGVDGDWVITRPGGQFLNAKLIGTDPRGDISYLKLQGPGPYPFVPLADSDAVKVGEAVIALGNPFGFSKDGSPHVSVGVVSAIHRFQGGYSDAIQTDTSINPGNSGGPLIDMQGRLIGINGRIAVRFGTRANTGVGYAIPTNQISAFLPRFRAGGVVSHGVLQGVRLDAPPEPGTGAQVRGIRAGSPAHDAGLREGDLVVAADGREVNGPRRLQGILGTFPAGSAVTLEVKRGDATETVAVELSARDRTVEGGGRGGYLGVRMSTVDSGGVELEEVVSDSPAEEAGLQTGDIIRLVGGQRIRDAAAFVRILSQMPPGHTLKLTVLRGETIIEVDVELGQRPG